MRRLLIVLALLAFAPSLQAQSLADKLTASRLAAQAEVALAQDPELRAFTFRPVVRGGVLTLEGRVDTAAQRDRAAELAAGVEGVTSVTNRVVLGGRAAVGAPELPPAPPPVAQDSVATGEEEEEEAAPAPEPEKEYYTVRRGDTLGAIAKRHGVSVRQIQRLNGLSGSRIRGGQRLRVK